MGRKQRSKSLYVLLVRPSDVEDLTRAMTQLIERREDRERPGKMGFKSVKETHSIEQIARRHEQIYSELLRSSAPGWHFNIVPN